MTAVSFVFQNENCLCCISRPGLKDVRWQRVCFVRQTAAAHVGLSCLPLCCLILYCSMFQTRAAGSKEHGPSKQCQTCFYQKKILHHKAHHRVSVRDMFFFTPGKCMGMVWSLCYVRIVKICTKPNDLPLYVTNSASPAIGAVPLPLGGLRHLLPPALAALVAAGLLTYLPAASR